nr:uncharacterized protein LOC114821722 [Malus domestica]
MSSLDFPVRFLEGNRLGYAKPISGEPMAVEGIFDHLRPFYGEPKVQFLAVIPLFLFGTALHHRCTDLKSRYTIPTSTLSHWYIRVLSMYDPHPLIYSILH